MKSPLRSGECISDSPEASQLTPPSSLVRTSGPTRLRDGSSSLKLWVSDTFGADSQGLRVVGASPDVSRAVRHAALVGTAVDVLHRIRKCYPYLAVLFRDKNNDPDTPFGVDIESLRGLTEVASVESAIFGGSRSHPERGGVAVLDLMDTYGLEVGLVETVPPCIYYFVASQQPLNRDNLTEALKQAKDGDDGVTTLLADYPIVLVPGADNAYINVLASDPKTYIRCGLVGSQ